MAQEDTENVLVTQLERTFKQITFFIRVPLEDLALVYPEAAECREKTEFLGPHLDTLKALIRLGLEHVPADVGRLAVEYPEVSRLLRGTRPWGYVRRGGGGGYPSSGQTR
jgi:hypothetical protein